MKLFDTHCHLASEDLFAQGEDLAQRAVQNEVLGLCLIATKKEDFENCKSLCQKLSQTHSEAKVAYTVGLHPHEAKSFDEELWSEIEERSKEASAIGETGLDFHYDFSDRKAQEKSFERHIDWAKSINKPLVIHCRESAEEIAGALKRSKIHESSPRPGILHCFTEDQKMAHRFLDLNLYLSFSGILTFNRAEDLRHVAATIPLDRLLIETDSPYLAPMPYRGKSNEPAYVRKVFDCLVKIRPESSEELAGALWENSLKVFKL